MSNKNISERVTWKYVKTKEDKSRRKQLPTKEARQVLAGDPISRRILIVLGSKLRQGYTASSMVVRKIIERK